MPLIKKETKEILKQKWVEGECRHFCKLCKYKKYCELNYILSQKGKRK